MHRVSILIALVALTGRADAAPDDDDESIEEEEQPDEPAAEEAEPVPQPAPRKAKRWSLALGPSVWAASIDASVALGPVQLKSSVPFAAIVQYLDGGVSGTLEARFDRFTASSSFVHGTLSAGTSRELAGATADVKGSLTTTLVEAAVGYDVIGGPDAPLTLSLRPGLRFMQLHVVAMGTLAIGPTTVTAGGKVGQGGVDYLVGARARLRLSNRVALVSTGDAGVGGVSDATWSISGELDVRIARWFGFAAGWRLLETQSGATTMRQNGPQLVMLFGL